jgi:arylformamidase
MRIFDVSMTIKSGMVVYPGNPKVKLTRLGKVSKIEMGSHAGTHVDTPRHALETDEGLEAFEFEQLLGECRVVDATHVKEGVELSDVEKLNLKAREKILFKTKNSVRGLSTWRDDYIYLSGDAADYLAFQKVQLVGIDGLSIKQRGSSDVRAHTKLLANGIAIIEGLDLSKIDAGKYTLIAVPLKLYKADGAPCRVLLIEGDIK